MPSFISAMFLCLSVLDGAEDYMFGNTITITEDAIDPEAKYISIYIYMQFSFYTNNVYIYFQGSRCSSKRNNLLSIAKTHFNIS